MTINLGNVALGKEFQGDSKNTCMGDCSLIASTFERSANYDTTEASVFAPFYRQADITKNFSIAAQSSLGSYLLTSTSTTAGLEAMAGEMAQAGTKEVPAAALVSSTIAAAKASAAGMMPSVTDLLGQSVMDRLKDCIPCIDRIMSLAELHPSLDLLGILRADVFLRLKLLNDLMSLLKNFDIYADYCDLLSMLGGMCIIDLQRLIALFYALLSFNAPKMDIFIGLLRGLIAPIFMPIMLGITTMLDQFALVVLSPIDCIIDNINFSIMKAKRLKMRPVAETAEDAAVALKDTLGSGMETLKEKIEKAKGEIQDKLEFYTQQIKKLLIDETSMGGAFIEFGLNKLGYIRLIAFMTALISALSKGQLACSREGRSPSADELDNFFANFLNPNIPYTLKVDPEGTLTVSDINPQYSEINLSEVGLGNAVDIFAEDTLPEDIAVQVASLHQAITSKENVVVPCTLKTSSSESDKIRSWIEELNRG